MEWLECTRTTETLRDEGKLRIRGDFDTQLATADNRARLFAFLTAFLGRTVSILSAI